MTTAAIRIEEVLRLAPVMPVIVVEREEEAVPLARALVRGGLCALEITLRTPVALAAVRLIADQVPAAVVGVGTVTRADQFALAAKAGAAFAVSPGLTVELAAAAQGSALPFLPGVMTPSEAIAARTAGYSALKLFPAEQAGGVGMLKALAGPFPDLVFCPTGGIDAGRARDYLRLPNVACVGGSWPVTRALVGAGNWSAIEQLAREAMALRPAAQGVSA